jgi:HSP20 family protein
MLWPIKKTERVLSPWESGMLHRSIDDLLEDFFGDFDVSRMKTNVIPRFELSETDEDVLIEAELPGMDENDVELTLNDDILHIRGEKKQEQTDQKKNYYLSERSYGRFERAIRLGPEVDAQNIDATFKKGVLSIRIPKSEPEPRSSRTIDIKAA